MKCEGSCEKHVGEVIIVYVKGYGQKGYFWYCEEAIAEDIRRGFVCRPTKHAPDLGQAVVVKDNQSVAPSG